MPHESLASDGDSSSIEPHVGAYFTAEFAPVHDGVLVARVAGDLDFVVTPSLRRRMVEQLGDSVMVLVIDLTPVTLLSAAAIEMLLDVVALAGDLAVSVRIVATNRAVLRPLRLTGTDRRLPLYDSFAHALGHA